MHTIMGASFPINRHRAVDEKKTDSPAQKPAKMMTQTKALRGVFTVGIRDDDDFGLAPRLAKHLLVLLGPRFNIVRLDETTAPSTDVAVVTYLAESIMRVNWSLSTEQTKLAQGEVHLIWFLRFVCVLLRSCCRQENRAFLCIAPRGTSLRTFTFPPCTRERRSSWSLSCMPSNKMKRRGLLSTTVMSKTSP